MTNQQLIDYVNDRLIQKNPDDLISDVDVAQCFVLLANHVGTMTTQANALAVNYPNMFSKLSVTLFINQATGNDNNDGLTEATAIASLLRASVIVKDKFVDVYLKIFGSYTHNIPDIVFRNANVTLSLQSGGLFIFQRRIYSMGAGYQNFECFSPLRFTGNVEIKGEFGAAVLPRIFLESIATFTTTNGLEKYYYDINRNAINVGTADVFSDNNAKSRTFALKDIKAEIYENATLGAGSGYGQYLFPTPDSNFAKFVEVGVTWALTSGAKKVHGFFGSSVLRNCTPISTSDLGVSEMVYDSNFGYINVGGAVKKFALTNL